MAGFLYDRIVRQGTVAEPTGVPDPQFALPSTVNWMRALAILVAAQNLNFQVASSRYAAIHPRAGTVQQENTVLEQCFLALHQFSALKALSSTLTKSNVARLAIVCWYYGIYYASSAMIAAQDGSFQDDHGGTANSWDRHIASRGLAFTPFDFRISSLVEKVAKAEITAIRTGSNHDLLIKPRSAADAISAVAGYLSGTASWYRWRMVEDVRTSKEFKDLSVSDFRTAKARGLRDQRLQKKTVGFLHEASRYRGKANYREALFLAYGSNTETLLTGFVDDLAIVLNGFITMSAAFASKRLGSNLWNEFVTDVEQRKAFTTSSVGIWT